MTSDERSRLEEELAGLRAELEERRRNLPAHSIRPHQILVIEEIEERIAEIARALEPEET